MRDNLKVFNELVLLRYQVYNSIFLTLELDGVHRTGILLPLLTEKCKNGFSRNLPPDEIIAQHFEDHPVFETEKMQLDQLFRYIQFVERQIVLVDALEDAAFDRVNNLEGPGSFQSFYQTVEKNNVVEKLEEALQNFRVKLVLTAHPTQFYPGPVLGIITDLARAIRENNLQIIKKLLAQLGKTPFFKKEKPSPYDEAVSLIWFLENVFYTAIPQIFEAINQQMGENAETYLIQNSLLQLGFWPGGDRDGNPFVDTNTTLQVADRLRTSLLKSYFRDIRKLKRRITFRGTEQIINEIEKRLYVSGFVSPDKPTITLDWFKTTVDNLRDTIEKDHNGLFIEEINDLRRKIKVFGLHFSCIDIRQDSRVIAKAFDALLPLIPQSESIADLPENITELLNLKKLGEQPTLDDPIDNDTIGSFYVIQEIQKRNGPLGCYRYIISNCRNEKDIARVFGMAKLAGMVFPMYLDVIPLFETIDDLKNAGDIMTRLYASDTYRKHLKARKNKQVVMLGFSDGTKDGGYITANWNIYRAKENISAVSREAGIQVVFFDGRGGPPARGGGNTHKFYASLGPTIDSSQIQITIQGQTISSNFGTEQSARFNMEQLLTAGLENQVLDSPTKVLSKSDRAILDELSTLSYELYQDFKAHPCFMPYLEKMSTLKYYSETNIGSRPAKRGKGGDLKLEDLRAIPFVGAWSQLKQNVPGFYGLGTAFAKFDDNNRIGELQALYKSSLFFKTLVENSMQSLSKSYFPLTFYMKKDEEFGAFWQIIFEESVRARKYLLKISGQKELLETNPSIKASINLREQIVLPLLTIQQHALIQIKRLENSGKIEDQLIESYKKLVVRSLYGNINASRNSA